MILKSINLPKGQRFPSSGTAIKKLFGNVEPLNAYLGYLSTVFEFDSRLTNKPKLIGPVIASLGVSRDRGAILQLYAVSPHTYPADAASEFNSQVLPLLRRWLDTQLSKPETEVLGYQQIIVEWANGKHRTHESRWL